MTRGCAATAWMVGLVFVPCAALGGTRDAQVLQAQLPADAPDLSSLQQVVKSAVRLTVSKQAASTQPAGADCPTNSVCPSPSPDQPPAQPPVQPPETDAPPAPPPEQTVQPGDERDPLAPADDPFDKPSADAWKVIDWVIATHDNNGLPFMIIDKVAADVFLFDPTGQKIGSAPALVGMAVGDEDTPGTGDRELSHIAPKDRKTPAGRFVAKFGRAAGGRDVLWIDYTTAISLHAVITVRNQHRQERLKSPTPDDNRITYGCINVPTAFYANVVKPLFKGTSGIVYILPDSKTLSDVFPALLQPPAVQPAAAQ